MEPAISDSARVAWNQMCARLGMGRTVKLDHRDLAWLFEISSGAVKWHEFSKANSDHALPAPALTTSESQIKRKKKKE